MTLIVLYFEYIHCRGRGLSWMTYLCIKQSSAESECTKFRSLTDTGRDKILVSSAGVCEHDYEIQILD